MRRIVLTFGFISGAVLSAMMAITMVFHDQIGFDNKGLILGYTTMVLAFLLVFFGIKAYRDNVGGGAVKFGKAFQVGLLIMLVSSACYVATWQVIYYKFMPDFMDKYAAHELEKARKAGASEAQVAAQAKQMTDFQQMYKNPLVNIAFTFLEPLPPGLLIVALSAGALRRKAAAVT